jgi:hypothetical protein
MENYMTLIISLAVFALAFVPYLLWRRWQESTATIYHGPARIISFDKSVSDKNSHYVVFQVPGLAKSLVEKIPNQRLQGCQPLLTSVTVTVKKRPFSSAWIDEIEWQPGQPEAVEQIPVDALIITACYALLGVCSLLVSVTQHFGHAGLWFSAGLLAFAGFCMNRYRLSKNDLQGTARLLGFRIGQGSTGLIIAALVIAFATGGCFWEANFLVIFPGINCAFELGGILALLATTARAS